MGFTAQVVRLSSGGSLKLSVGKIRTVAGKVLCPKGLQPDDRVYHGPPTTPRAAGSDPPAGTQGAGGVPGTGQSRRVTRAEDADRRGPSRSVLLVVLGVGLGAGATLLVRGCARRAEPPAPAPRPRRRCPRRGRRLRSGRPATPGAALRFRARGPRRRGSPRDRHRRHRLRSAAPGPFSRRSRVPLAARRHSERAARVRGGAARAGEGLGPPRSPADGPGGRPRPRRARSGRRTTTRRFAAGVLAALARFPGALGINNHQGSKATADARVVRGVLGVVKEKGPLLPRLADDDGVRRGCGGGEARRSLPRARRLPRRRGDRSPRTPAARRARSRPRGRRRSRSRRSAVRPSSSATRGRRRSRSCRRRSVCSERRGTESSCGCRSWFRSEDGCLRR